LLKALGLLPMATSLANGGSPGNPSSVKPRHVLCFLGGQGDLSRLSDAASFGISQFATGFSVDKTYSQDQPDSRMEPSFGVSWDRVEPGAWTKADEDAVANHKCVLYVLGPRMMPDTADDRGASAGRGADQGGRNCDQGRKRRRRPWHQALAAARLSMRRRAEGLQ
jgi:hypothetical protein